MLSRAGAGTRAYEVKFLVTEEVAAELDARLRPWLSPDPHGDVRRGGAYSVMSLYCDTPGMEVYHRVGQHRSRKFRVRRYGDGKRAYLERKVRKGNRVAKQRVEVELAEVVRLGEADSATGWAGAGFRGELIRRWLRPVAAVAYERSAMVGGCDEGPMRLTFDRGVRGSRADGWRMEPGAESQGLFNGRVVCEFKFLGAMPTPLRRAAEALRLVPGGVSKYRRCVEMLRLAGEGPCLIG